MSGNAIYPDICHLKFSDGGDKHFRYPASTACLSCFISCLSRLLFRMSVSPPVPPVCLASCSACLSRYLFRLPVLPPVSPVCLASFFVCLSCLPCRLFVLPPCIHLYVFPVPSICLASCSACLSCRLFHLSVSHPVPPVCLASCSACLSCRLFRLSVSMTVPPVCLICQAHNAPNFLPCLHSLRLAALPAPNMFCLASRTMDCPSNGCLYSYGKN
jgi:hypothetical protein